MSKMYKSSMLKESVEKVNTKEKIRMNSEEKIQVLESVLFEKDKKENKLPSYNQGMAMGGSIVGGIAASGENTRINSIIRSALEEMQNSIKHLPDNEKEEARKYFISLVKDQVPIEVRIASILKMSAIGGVIGAIAGAAVVKIRRAIKSKKNQPK